MLTLSLKSPTIFAKAPKKLIAMTFDDGFLENLTPKLLKILKKENVKATIIILGFRAKMYPDIIRKISNAGHQIGNHMYNHENLAYFNKYRVIKEIENTSKIIKQITRKQPIVMRPPYGAYNKKVLACCNMPVILWSVVPQDWKTRDAETVYKAVVKNAKNGDIILVQ